MKKRTPGKVSRPFLADSDAHFGQARIPDLRAEQLQMEDACRKLRARVQYWAKRIKVVPTQIRVQPMKRKWASCSTKGWISLNAALIKQPRRFQDYAIVHELLHLEIPNHGKLFKCMMNSYLPGWSAGFRQGR